jgi:hypothetical protein
MFAPEDQTKVRGEEKMKMTSNGRRPQAIKIYISQQPLIRSYVKGIKPKQKVKYSI